MNAEINDLQREYRCVRTVFQSIYVSSNIIIIIIIIINIM